MSTVYVLNKDGKPLMPTTRCGHVRHLLKEQKARVVTSKPFTIQLLYETNDVVQPLYFKPTVIRTKDEMHEFYRTQPDEMILAALVEVDDKATGKRYCSIRVWCSGHEVKTRSMGSYYVLNKHYLTVNKDDMVATYPYPFSCDDGANTLLEAKDTDILTPVERLFLWTEYKNPNPIETKKK